jgi:hypothetical protein
MICNGEVLQMISYPVVTVGSLGFSVKVKSGVATVRTKERVVAQKVLFFTPISALPEPTGKACGYVHVL